MDHRAVRLALGLTIAGASLLAAGVAIWLVTDVGRVTSGLAARDLRLAALALLAGGGACGLAMGFVLTAAGRARGGSRRVPAGAAELAGGIPGFPGPVPSLPEPQSLMNPPPAGPPPPAPWRLAPSAGQVRGTGLRGTGLRGTGRRGTGRRGGGRRGAAVRRSGARGHGLVAGAEQPGRHLGRHLRGVAPLAARARHPAAAPAQR